MQIFVSYGCIFHSFHQHCFMGNSSAQEVLCFFLVFAICFSCLPLHSFLISSFSHTDTCNTYSFPHTLITWPSSLPEVSIHRKAVHMENAGISSLLYCFLLFCDLLDRDSLGTFVTLHLCLYIFIIHFLFSQLTLIYNYNSKITSFLWIRNVKQNVINIILIN